MSRDCGSHNSTAWCKHKGSPMKYLTKTVGALITALALMCGAVAMADTNLTAGASSGSSAGAQAGAVSGGNTLTTGKSTGYSSSVVGAYCTAGVGLAGVGASWTVKKCLDWNIMSDAAKLGAFSPAEMRAIAQHLTGIQLSTDSGSVTTKSTSNRGPAPKVAAPSTAQLTVQVAGERYVLKGAQVTKWNNCVPFRFGAANSPLSLKAGCK